MDDKQTFWCLLKGEDLEQIREMARVEKRPFSSVIRVALDHYYRTRYAEDTLKEMAG